eukprot:gene6940-biopygen12399
MVHADDDAGMLDIDLEDTSGIDWNEKFGKHPSSYDCGTSGHDTIMLASPSNPFSRTVLYRSWVIDTGATRHMTSNRQLLKHIKLLPRPIQIRTASNHQLICTHSGTARIPGLRGGTILLYDVLLSLDEVARDSPQSAALWHARYGHLSYGGLAQLVTNQQDAPVNILPLAAIVGSLNYLAVCTRPDIAQAVNRLARHSSKPMAEHMTAATGILSTSINNPATMSIM